MSTMAMRMAMSMPTSPASTPATRAVLTCPCAVMRRKRPQKSTVKAVEMLLMLEAMVLMVAAKTAAMSSPASPAGSWLIMKKGKMASVFCMVMSMAAGWVLKKV